MKKTIVAIACLLAFYSCSKKNDSPSQPDSADQFVGSYKGTLKVYENNVLQSTTDVPFYSITKASKNEINLLAEGDPAPIGTVAGNSFTASFTTSNNGATIHTSITGTLSNGVLTETGISDATNGTTTAHYTLSATYTKQ